MARNTRRSNGMKKIEPAVKTLFFSSPTITSGNTDRFYIDISQCVSLLNRRFYRQGLNWAVSGFKITTTSTDGFVYVNKLPETWVMSNAWEKSFRAWQQMIKNATDSAGSESIKGKFLDFKIFANAQHHLDGVGANLLPVSFDSATGVPGVVTAAAGQWQMSDVTIPKTFPAAGQAGETTDFELIAVGPNGPGAGASGKDAKSIIQGYADSRALPDIEDPNVPAGASQNWMMRLFSEGTQQDEDVTNMLEGTGDKAPYPFEGDGVNVDTMYPGGETQLAGLQIHDQTPITGTTIGNVTRLSGGMFPCGLIEIYAGINSGASANFAIQIDLVPGDHRGYLCEPMTEM